MFVTRSRLKTLGAVTVTSALLGVSGCGAPTATTDLRPEGPPEVLSVLVMDDPGGFFETATFCKVGDPKRPALVAAGLSFETVQICDDDLSLPAGSRSPDPADPTGQATIFTPGGVENAVATGWHVRIMFDELLNPSIEDLIAQGACTATGDTCTQDPDCPAAAPGDPANTCALDGTFSGSLLNTQPVVLKCTPPGSTTAAVVDYDGYYSPSGNAFTWPLGPSLFIQPVDFSAVATGSTCNVTINDNVTDKEGNKVPDDQRGGDIYSWTVESLQFLESSPAVEPAGMEDTITPDSPLALSFNAFIDASTLGAGEVTIKEAPGMDCAAAAAGVAKPAVITQLDPQTIGIGITPAAGCSTATVDCVWNPNKTYVIEFSADNAVTDLAGGPATLPGASDFSLCFFTDVAPT